LRATLSRRKSKKDGLSQGRASAGLGNLEAVDIDEELDFRMAEFLYKEREKV
jgi:CMP-N-acetylneuraminic acid synthetase